MIICVCGKQASGAARCTQCGVPLCPDCIRRSRDGKGPECQQTPPPGPPSADTTITRTNKPEGHGMGAKRG